MTLPQPEGIDIIRERYARFCELLAPLVRDVRTLDRHLCALALVAGEIDRVAPARGRAAKQMALRVVGEAWMRVALGHGTFAAVCGGAAARKHPAPALDLRTARLVTTEASAVLAWLLAHEVGLARVMAEIEWVCPDLDLSSDAAITTPTFEGPLPHLTKRVVEENSQQNRGTDAVLEWLTALGRNAAPQWTLLERHGSFLGLGPRDEANAIFNAAFHHAARGAEGRATSEGIVEIAGGECGALLARRVASPARYATGETFGDDFPWTFERFRLYEEHDEDEARGAARAVSAREALEPWFEQRRLLLGAGPR